MKKFSAALLIFTLLVMLIPINTVSVFAVVSKAQIEEAIEDTASYIYMTVENPEVASIGGEWAVMGLARSGVDIPDEYYQAYYETVEEYVKECKGVLHKKKYTEYSRVIVALSAIGKDARNVAGYDLTKALGDYESTIWQGINGPIWALIALDSKNYPMPVNEEATIQATRQMYIDRILDCQLEDGGWSLFGGMAAVGSSDGTSDPDITGMALQALAKYQNQPEVAKATINALDCLSKMQDDDGGYASWGTANSESIVQVIVALCELGISLEDSRFVKGVNTLLDNLMSYYKKNEGFSHTSGGSGSNQMATEQGFYGIVAVDRAMTNKNSLYRMSDAISITDKQEGTSENAGVEGRNPAVKQVPVVTPGITFDDVSGVNAHINQMAIESLASRGIINGKGQGKFDPDANMTRAEFAAIVVRALGLVPESTDCFTDVQAGKWYAPYIGTAYNFGIINGVGNKKFNPEGTISKQEAAVMTARAAKLCGMDTALEINAVRDVLAQFGDYVKSADWARESLAFCYSNNILDQSDIFITPTVSIKRCEIAQMLYNLLAEAELL